MHHAIRRTVLVVAVALAECAICHRVHTVGDIATAKVCKYVEDIDSVILCCEVQLKLSTIVVHHLHTVNHNLDSLGCCLLGSLSDSNLASLYAEVLHLDDCLTGLRALVGCYLKLDSVGRSAHC